MIKEYIHKHIYLRIKYILRMAKLTLHCRVASDKILVVTIITNMESLGLLDYNFKLTDIRILWSWELINNIIHAINKMEWLIYYTLII